MSKTIKLHHNRSSLVVWLIKRRFAKTERQANSFLLLTTSLLLLLSLVIFSEGVILQNRTIPYERLPKQVRATYPQFIQHLHAQE